MAKKDRFVDGRIALPGHRVCFIQNIDGEVFSGIGVLVTHTSLGPIVSVKRIGRIVADNLLGHPDHPAEITPTNTTIH